MAVTSFILGQLSLSKRFEYLKTLIFASRTESVLADTTLGKE
ncbi:hypothetical protein RRSWK_02142 [Rhodopirellula sp. SWK7]|nr:hypothetical protein RRSWK_02142 [Rhodopirellula sp. SWK7]